MVLAYRRVPMFGYEDRQFRTAGKPEGVGWDNLGQRDILGVVLHRMVGSLNGTDGWFARNDVPSLTDYGVGVRAMDGNFTGYIYQWNNPRGYRSGWASGPVSAPYGDGILFVNKYGINAVNRRLVSMEISGQPDTPIDDFALQEIIHFIAWHADQAGISHEAFPHYHVTGMSFLFYHDEMTFGTGKRCPFGVVKGLLNRIIAGVKALLKTYQTGVAAPAEEPPIAGHIKEPAKPVESIPAPRYARPIPVKELALLGKEDKDTAASLVLVNGVNFTYVNDRVRAIRDTPRLQYAYQSAKHVGPLVRKGEEFEVLWHFIADDGKPYYLTGWWTRIQANDTQRVKD